MSLQDVGLDFEDPSLVGPESDIGVGIFISDFRLTITILVGRGVTAVVQVGLSGVLLVGVVGTVGGFEIGHSDGGHVDSSCSLKVRWVDWIVVILGGWWGLCLTRVKALSYIYSVLDESGNMVPLSVSVPIGLAAW